MNYDHTFEQLSTFKTILIQLQLIHNTLYRWKKRDVSRLLIFHVNIRCDNGTFNGNIS